MKAVGYVWRKYDCGRPLFQCDPTALDPADNRYVLWAAVDDGQFPALNRWESLGSSFLGFVSCGLGAPVACAYDARGALETLFRDVIARVWISGADEAQAYEYLNQHLLGVWMGDKTPFLVTQTPCLEDILKNPL